VEVHSARQEQQRLQTTGATGGTFSATPAGLVIDANTGVIDLGASTPNTYDITYSFGTAPCTGTATSQVTVSINPTATVSGGTFCAREQQLSDNRDNRRNILVQHQQDL
jgi:hypothetical protein